MSQGQTQREWQEEMAGEILSLIRSELYLEFRYLDVALSALRWAADDSIDTFGTDGEQLYYSASQLLRVFPKNPKFLDRLYLHSVLHCIYAHLWIAGGREPQLWGLACDIMVEYTIDHFQAACTKRVLSGIRGDVYRRIEANGMGVSAAIIYQLLLGWQEELTSLQQEFYTDTHKYWPAEKQAAASPAMLQKRWEQIARQTQMQMEQKGGEQTEGQELLEQEIRAGRSRRSYRAFLRKFAVFREELHLDPDEFDVNYYSYGLRFYGNMPLIEAVESQEMLKIRDFVIVIDTSYSTSGELVKAFLRETLDILMETEHFFQGSRIHIIQCDDRVQSDQVVTTSEQLDQVLQSFHLLGGGGTDFRPAFRYINQLVEEGQLPQLKGILYFTDGQGIYPAKRPDYQTAFLFMADYDETQVPPWAMRLRLEPTDLRDI